MIIACLIGIMLNGSISEVYMTGNVVSTRGSDYIVDFSNSADFIGLKGDYSKVPVSEENCSVKNYRSTKRK